LESVAEERTFGVRDPWCGRTPLDGGPPTALEPVPVLVLEDDLRRLWIVAESDARVRVADHAGVVHGLNCERFFFDERTVACPEVQFDVAVDRAVGRRLDQGDTPVSVVGLLLVGAAGDGLLRHIARGLGDVGRGRRRLGTGGWVVAGGDDEKGSHGGYPEGESRELLHGTLLGIMVA